MADLDVAFVVGLLPLAEGDDTAEDNQYGGHQGDGLRQEKAIVV